MPTPPPTPNPNDKDVQNRFPTPTPTPAAAPSPSPPNNLVATPPPSSETAANKRRRTHINHNIGKPSDSDAEVNEAAGKKGYHETEVPTEETPYGKEIEMKDAEELEAEIQESKSSTKGAGFDKKQDGGDKAWEDNGPDHDKGGGGGEVKSESESESENTKQDEQPPGDPAERVDVAGGESGKHVLNEVATLLKQVQEKDSKAKLEVEVKVKKMDGVVKEEDR